MNLYNQKYTKLVCLGQQWQESFMMLIQTDIGTLLMNKLMLNRVLVYYNKYLPFKIVLTSMQLMDTLDMNNFMFFIVYIVDIAALIV